MASSNAKYIAKIECEPLDLIVNRVPPKRQLHSKYTNVISQQKGMFLNQ